MKQLTTIFRQRSPCNRLTLMALMLPLLNPHAVSAMVVYGQVDDFEGDTTTQGWTMGPPDSLPHVAHADTGGPTGLGDAFLETWGDGGGGPGSKLTVFNKDQWTGNYTSTGVTAISMDLKNLSNQSLEIFLAVNGPGGAFSTSGSAALTANSDWTQVVFSLAPGDLVGVSGNAVSSGTDVSATLAGITQLRIIHSNAPDWNGLAIDANLGVDNISAVPIPAALPLMGSALIGLIGVGRRRRNG